MNLRYKIILSNNNFYKEIELTEDLQQIKVGTGVDCDVRLRKELFLVKWSWYLQEITKHGLLCVPITFT